MVAMTQTDFPQLARQVDSPPHTGAPSAGGVRPTARAIAHKQDPGAQQQIRVAVSTVIFTLRPAEKAGERDRVAIPLVRRTRDPHHGQWALPGGWLGVAEGLDAAASRTLAETTGLAPSFLEQLYAFGDVHRSPSRVVSIIYWALLRRDEAAAALVGENVAWFDATALPELAFDHNQIVDYALWRLRTKVGYSRIAHGLLGDEFTLAELREVYESILERRLDPANFRRQVEGSGSVLPTERYRTGNHRPARLYHYNHEVELADRGPLAREFTTALTPHHPTESSES
jgi:ADP-ribose pyrophosphatase YjhB (NUDIX family)